MATDRGCAYNAPDPCSESLEKMTKRLTSDLRARVRRLAHHAPLSLEWIEMTDTLQHLASVALMEEKDSTKKECFLPFTLQRNNFLANEYELVTS